MKSLVNLGTVLLQQRKLEDAEDQLRQALELDRKVFGDRHPETLKTMNNLALTLRELGSVREAEGLHRETLAIQHVVLGPGHPDTQRSLLNLINLVRGQGRISVIRPLVEELVAAKRERATSASATPEDLNDYAWILLTCELPDLRDPAVALLVAERAVDLDDSREP
ncbi:MAG: tetratricopeptide repeat protein [Planctomycetota bacterium]